MDTLFGQEVLTICTIGLDVRWPAGLEPISDQVCLCLVRGEPLGSCRGVA